MTDLFDTRLEALGQDFYQAEINTDSDGYGSDYETESVNQSEGINHGSDSEITIDHVTGAFSSLTVADEYEEHYDFIMRTNPFQWFPSTHYEHVVVSAGESSGDSGDEQESSDEEYRRFRTRPASQRGQRSISPEANDDAYCQSTHDDGVEEESPVPIPNKNAATNESIISLSSLGTCLAGNTIYCIRRCLNAHELIFGHSPHPENYSMASYPAKIIADEIQQDIETNPLFTANELVCASVEIMDTWLLSRARFINNDDCKFIPFSWIKTLASTDMNEDAHRAVRNLLEIPSNSHDEYPEVFNKTVVLTVIKCSLKEVQECYPDANEDEACEFQAIIAMSDKESTSIVIQDKNENHTQEFLELDAVSGYNRLLASIIKNTWTLTSRAFGWRRVETEVDPTIPVEPLFARRECVRGGVGSDADNDCSNSIVILYIAGHALEYGLDFDDTQSCFGLQSHSRKKFPCLHAVQRELFISSWSLLRTIFQKHKRNSTYIYDSVYQLAHSNLRQSFPSKSFRPRKTILNRLEEHIKEVMELCQCCAKQQRKEILRSTLHEDQPSIQLNQYRKEQLSEVRVPAMPTDDIKRPKVPALRTFMKHLEKKKMKQAHQACGSMDADTRMDTASSSSSEDDDTSSSSESTDSEPLSTVLDDSEDNNDNDSDSHRSVENDRDLANKNPLLNSAGYLSMSTGQFNMQEINKVITPDQGWRLVDNWFRGFLSESPHFLREHLVSPGRRKEDFLYRSSGEANENIKLVSLHQLNSLPSRVSATGHHNGSDIRLNIEPDGPIPQGLEFTSAFHLSGDIDSVIHVGPKLVIDPGHGMPVNSTPTYSRRIPFRNKNYVNISLRSPQGEIREFDLSQVPFAVISKMGSSKAPAWVYIGFPQLISANPDRAGRFHYNGSLGNKTLHFFWNNVLLPSLTEVTEPIGKQRLPQDVSHSTIRRGNTQSIASHILPGAKVENFTERMRQTVSNHFYKPCQVIIN
jgi:hypothetical protein